MDDCHLDYLVLHHKIEKMNDNMPLCSRSFCYSVRKEGKWFWAFFLALKASNLIGFLIGFLDSTQPTKCLGGHHWESIGFMNTYT
jgi:hypothetical protein